MRGRSSQFSWKRYAYYVAVFTRFTFIDIWVYSLQRRFGLHTFECWLWCYEGNAYFTWRARQKRSRENNWLYSASQLMQAKRETLFFKWKKTTCVTRVVEQRWFMCVGGIWRLDQRVRPSIILGFTFSDGSGKKWYEHNYSCAFIFAHCMSNFRLFLFSHVHVR